MVVGRVREWGRGVVCVEWVVVRSWQQVVGSVKRTPFPPHYTHWWFTVSVPTMTYCDKSCAPSLEVNEMSVGSMEGGVGGGDRYCLEIGEWASRVGRFC